MTIKLSSTINVNVLHTFVVLSETLTFSLAAKRLKISQPAVTRQIAQLEDKIGTQLFIRNSKGVILTEAGKNFFAEIVPVWLALTEKISELSHNSRSLSGTVTIASPAEIGHHFLLPLLLRFQKIFPNILLDISFTTVADVSNGVVSGKYGLGIFPGIPEIPGASAWLLLKEKFVAVTAATNNLSLDKDTNPALVAYRKDDPVLKNYFDKFYKKNIKITQKKWRIQVCVNEQRSMIQALLHSNTYAIVPELSVRNELKNGSLKLASDNKLVNNVYLIAPDNDLEEKKYRELKKYLLANKQIS